MTTTAVDVTLRRVAELACRAPSIGNSQPWRWSVSGDRIDLWSDPDRRLVHSDPAGRQLVLSIGAALHHARVVAAALGRPADVLRLPEPDRPELMATLHTRPGPVPPGALEELDALEQRRTDRRRFTTWPVAEERVALLARAAESPDVGAVALADREARAVTDRLVHLATGDERSLLPADGLLALCTDADDRGAWLRAGEALSALWLRATAEGLSVVPLSEVIESERTRTPLRNVLAGPAHPQLLVRVGWQEIGGRAALRSARRSLVEVLDEPRPTEGRPR